MDKSPESIHDLHVGHHCYFCGLQHDMSRHKNHIWLYNPSTSRVLYVQQPTLEPGWFVIRLACVVLHGISCCRLFDNHPEIAESACRLTLKNLQLDYLNLYLIHAPFAMRIGAPLDFTAITDDDRLAYDADRISKVWEVSVTFVLSYQAAANCTCLLQS